MSGFDGGGGVGGGEGKGRAGKGVGEFGLWVWSGGRRALGGFCRVLGGEVKRRVYGAEKRYGGWLHEIFRERRREVEVKDGGGLIDSVKSKQSPLSRDVGDAVLVRVWGRGAFL